MSYCCFLIFLGIVLFVDVILDLLVVFFVTSYSIFFDIWLIFCHIFRNFNDYNIIVYVFSLVLPAFTFISSCLYTILCSV